jgi:exopolysaccharide production protein ExoZ
LTLQADNKATLRSVHGLRFVAIVLVVVFHSLRALGPPLISIPVGATGVDLFFVISGVVIGYAGSKDGPITFMVKRLIRIIPLYWVATLIYIALQYCLYGTSPALGNIGHSLFLVPNFSTENWYPIYYPGWTLCFEMAFYILFAVVLSWTRTGATVSTAIVAAGLSAILIPVPFVPGAFFDTSLCLEFALGLVIAEAMNRGYRLSLAAGIFAICGGVGLMAIEVGDLSPPRSVHWGIPAAMIVFGALGLEHRRFWLNRFLVVGGDASYAIYLSHVSIMELLYVKLSGFGLDLHGSGVSILLRELLLLSGAVAIGILVHIWIERPMLSALRSGALRARLIPLPVARPILSGD